MRPFGCHVTILNIIDYLGKFFEKADEGFFVGYFTNSKAFRVFNSRTRIVKENLHVKFSENTPNIAGSGPNWLFDIDALTKSMNYKSVVTGDQSNGSAGDEKKKDVGDPGNEDSEILSTEESRGNQEKKDNVNSTNRVNAVSSTVNTANNEVNAVDRKLSIKLPDDPNMPDLEDINIFKDSNEEVFGAEVDLNNLEYTFQVSPIPIKRIYKDYPL
nr:retrovirus-related Pol polyprotein from transposon TNT 1-94 [Tanacetum cinerariifolium]